jgi:hypothetical protein
MLTQRTLKDADRSKRLVQFETQCDVALSS